METNSHFLVVRALKNDVEMEALRAATLADPAGHLPIFPTHGCYLGDEIIGSLSCCATPVSGIWAHSQKSTPRHTREMVNIARNITRQINGGRPFITMCSETSPIYPFMERMDFHRLGPTVIFLGKEDQ